MRTPLPHRSCWPSPEQELLLEAVLGPGHKTAKAWELWSLKTDFKNLDAGSYRLLPLLYARLSAREIPAPQLALLKGVYRYSLCRNRLRIAAYEELDRQLKILGIPFLALKGIALTALYYRDVAQRPMDDLDILIHARDEERVVTSLIAAGYRRESTHALLTKAINLVSPRGVIVDIHRELSLDSCGTSLSKACWDTQASFAYDSLNGKTLSPTVHLFHTLSHGLVWNTIPSIRWVVDAALILSQSKIDWPLLYRQAEGNRLSRTLTEGLSYLKGRFAIPVPESRLSELKRISVSRMEEWEFRCKTVHRYDAPFGWRFIARLWRHSRGVSWFEKIPVFKAVLFGYLGTDSWRAVARLIFSRFGQRYRLFAPSREARPA